MLSIDLQHAREVTAGKFVSLALAALPKDVKYKVPENTAA
jgi:hypothetical protein